MATVLVTGASGFLGRYTVDALLHTGWQVAVTGRCAPAIEGAHISVAADLLKPNDTQALLQCVKPDVLLHLAWFDDPRLRWHAVDNLAWASATLKLVEQFAGIGGTRVVFGSSCAVYDFKARSLHTEADRTGPSSLYGTAKAATASLLLAAQQELGLDAVEARIFFCYGAGEPSGRLVPDLINGISRGQPVPCTDGVQMRDYLHAADVASALQLLVSGDCTGVVNVGSGTSIAVADLVNEIASQMGRPDLPKPGALIRHHSEPMNIVADISRLRELGFRPKFELSRGVAETLSQILQHA